MNTETEKTAFILDNGMVVDLFSTYEDGKLIKCHIEYTELIKVDLVVRDNDRHKTQRYFQRLMNGVGRDAISARITRSYNQTDYTYLVYDGQRYKIGRSNFPVLRVNDLRTANPSCELLCFSKNVAECVLHYVFLEKRLAREWFLLNDRDEKIIRFLMTQNKDRANSISRIVREMIKQESEINNPDVLLSRSKMPITDIKWKPSLEIKF